MNKGMNKKIYISGRVSSLPYDIAHRRFSKKEKELKDRGWKVINPMKYCCEVWPWWLCMIVCVMQLLRCNTIYMMRGWTQSRGARLEYKIAKKFNLYICNEENQN